MDASSHKIILQKPLAKIKKTSRVSKTVSNIGFNDYSGQEKYVLLIHIHG